jgi:hypothetical protein
MLIRACIVIGFVSRAQIAPKDESGSPLYLFRAAQVIEALGLAPSDPTK